MKLSDELGLPVEAINQAAAYFVEKTGDYHKHMVTLHRGEHAVIYRQDLYLFLKLKINGHWFV